VRPDLERLERVRILTKPFSIDDLYRVIHELAAADPIP
jgi:hypothetical protein